MALMTPSEFVARAMQAPGIPWKRWASSWTACDCFGLVALYFCEVLGIDLGPVPQTDLAAGFDAMPGWKPCEAEPGTVGFMAYLGGAPSHCGVFIGEGMVIHSEGSEVRPGGVRLARLSAMQRVYGDIRFFRYPPC